VSICTQEVELEYDFINKKVRAEYGMESDRNLWRSASGSKSIGGKYSHNNTNKMPQGFFETVKYKGGSLLQWLSGGRGHTETAGAGGGGMGDGGGRGRNGG
jgi:hypothetical protein